MKSRQRLTREDSGQALSFVISDRERERVAIRKRQAQRRVFIATISSVAVLGTLLICVVASPGWKVVKATFFDVSYGREVLHLVIHGLLTNLQLTVIASISIAICAMGLALARTSQSAAMTPFRILATVYVDVFRGIPLLLVIFLIGFGVPALRIAGVTSNVTVLGTIAVIMTYSAYVAEVLRSGILSVHPSQRAAARSLGLSQGQTLRFVVLPQALKRVVPPLLNDLVALLKDTGLVSILGVTDAIRAAQIEGSQTFNYTPYVVAAILFLLITVPLTRYTDHVLARSIARQNAQGSV